MKLVFIRWRDAASCDHDSVPEAWMDHDCIRQSGGILVKQTDIYLLLATDYDMEFDGVESWGRVQKVPLSLIVYRKDFEID